MNFDNLFNKFKKNAPAEALGVEVNPEALAFITAGDQAFQQDNFPVAIAHYTRAIALQSHNRYPLSKRGKCYQMTQQYDKALSDLFKSKDLDDNFENNQYIAECYLFKKDYSTAISYFDIAVKKLEENESNDKGNMTGINYAATKARALNNQAVCYFNLQQLDKAIECTSKGIRENPYYPNNHSIRGMIYLQQGNKAQAITDLQNAARLGDARANAILSQI